MLDVQNGRAVHAVAGDRAHYRPLRSILHPEPEPLALARACRERLGATELYLADLDAIAGAPPATELYQAIAELGLTLWLDAGIRDAGDLPPLRATPGVLVLGLETLAGPEALRRIVLDHGSDDRDGRLALSLDLRDNRPVVARGADWGSPYPAQLIRRAGRFGLAFVRRLIVLDLARVGTGQGPGTLNLIRELRRRPGKEIVAGGGVAGPDDLRALEDAGASAVLVGSALHDGRLDLRGRPG